MPINTKTILFSTALLISVASCRNNESDKDIKDASPYFSLLLTGNEDAVFRDIDFNAGIDAVKKTEKAKLYESTSDHLFYELSFPKDSTLFAEYANLQYFFNEDNQLDIITVDVFLSDSLQESTLKNTLTSYYNQKFKTIESEEADYPVWKAGFKDKETNQSYNYTIALKDVPDDFGVSLEYMRE